MMVRPHRLGAWLAAVALLALPGLGGVASATPTTVDARAGAVCNTVAQTITQRRGISCEQARTVARRSTRAGKVAECRTDPVQRWRGWTIRGIGKANEVIAARYTNGSRSFVASGGGAC